MAILGAALLAAPVAEAKKAPVARRSSSAPAPAAPPELAREAPKVEPTRASRTIALGHRAHRKGMALARRGRHEEALVLLERAVRSLPRSSRAAYDRIVVLSWAGRHWEAAEAFEALRAPELAPGWVRREVAEAYRAIHRPGQSLALYASLLVPAPNDPVVLERVALLLLEERERLLEPGLALLAKPGAVPPPVVTRHRWAEPRHAAAIRTAARGDAAGAMDTLREALLSLGRNRRTVADWLVFLYLSRRFPELVSLADTLSGEELVPLAPIVSAAHAACGQNISALNAALRECVPSSTSAEACGGTVHRLIEQGRTGEAEGFAAQLLGPGAERVRADVQLHSGRIGDAEKRYLAAVATDAADGEAHLGLAAALAVQGKTAAASQEAAQAIRLLSLDEYLLHRVLPVQAATALASVFNGLGNHAEALAVLRPLLAAQPDHGDAILQQARAYDGLLEDLAAAQAWDRLVRLAPDDRAAAVARTRALARLMAAGPVKEALEAAPAPSPGMTAAAQQLEAIRRWRVARAAASGPAEENGSPIPGTLEEEAKLALAALQPGGELPGEPAALRVVAEAHRELGEDARALDAFRALETRLEERGAAGTDEHLLARFEQVGCLARLMRFREAEALLDGIDASLPMYRFHRSDRTPHQEKADVAIERGWLLLANNRPAGASRRFDELLLVAPGSATLRGALGHACLARGWPRRALQLFETATAADPDDIGTREGLARALHATGRHEEAERITGELASTFPADRHVRELVRMLDVARMTELRLEFGSDSEVGVPGGLEASLTLAAPLGWRFALNAAARWKREGSGEWMGERRRATLGAVVTPHHAVRVEAAASLDPSSGFRGAFADVQLSPSDHLSLAFRGDSDSAALPPGAVRADLSGADVEGRIEIRHDSTLHFDTRARLLAMSDGNRISEASANGRGRLFASGRWQLTLGAEVAGGVSSLEETPYYSPTRSWAALLSPAVEHIWASSRRYALEDRLVIETGLDRVRGFDIADRSSVSYEQMHRFRDRGELRLELGLWHRTPEGTPETGWHGSVGTGFRF